MEEWTVQKRLDRGETVGKILESYQVHDIVGNTAEGGVIVDVNPEEKKGLVLYPQIIASEIVFGCNGSWVTTDRFSYTGSENTSTLLNTCDSLAVAAYVCDTLNANGFSDWFLPAADDLEFVMNVIKNEGLMLGEVGSKFWSSSVEYNQVYFWTISGTYYQSQEKDSTANVVALRMFTF